MIKCKLVTLVWMSTVILGSVFAPVGATPGDCINLRRTNCCSEMVLCVIIGPCGLCCGEVDCSSRMLVTFSDSVGWDPTTVFPVDQSGPECIYFPAKCNVPGGCDVETFTTQAYCVADLSPGIPHNCS